MKFFLNPLTGIIKAVIFKENQTGESKMLKFWKASIYFNEIEEVLAERESKNFIQLSRGRRISKKTDSYGCFPTEQEAWNWLIECHKKELKRAQLKVEKINEIIAHCENKLKEVIN